MSGCSFWKIFKLFEFDEHLVVNVLKKIIAQSSRPLYCSLQNRFKGTGPG